MALGRTCVAGRASQKHVVTASFLGWTLDALDFFLYWCFVIKDIAAEFDTSIPTVTVAVTLTLGLPAGRCTFVR